MCLSALMLLPCVPSAVLLWFLQPGGAAPLKIDDLHPFGRTQGVSVLNIVKHSETDIACTRAHWAP